MRFLKSKVLSRFSPSDQTLFTNQYGRAVMNLAGGLRLPKGTTAERPQGTKSGDSSVRTLGGVNGFIRYNTDIDPDTGLEIGIEAYVGGAWEILRAPGAGAIVKQTITTADGIETTFGPLERIPASENNIIVLVENVFQISDTNFNLSYNYLGTPGDTRIVFTSPPPPAKNITIYFGYAD